MENRGLSRRQWFERMSVPVLGASVGGTLAMRPAPAVAQPAAADEAALKGARTYNVRSFGAVGDGKAMDTRAVQAAIDACTRDGGGTVLVPEGTFQMGTVELKDNVTLHLAASATLLGTADGTQYHAVDAIPLRGDSTLADGNWALLFAVNAKNVTIEGAGLIDGQGIQFHSPSRGVAPPSGLGGSRRPYHLLFYRCEHLRVADVRLWNSAFHSVRVIQSHYVWMTGLHIFNRVNGNNDGFHFISCEYVHVNGCTVQSQDDACALFGSCKFITVTNSTFSTRWSVFRFGGGEAENVTVSNCVLHQVFGCPFKFQGRPGSRYENMSFSNLILQDVTGPISISIGPLEQRPDQPVAAGAPAAASQGAPAIVRNITFSNVHGTVTTNPPQLPEYPFTSGYRPGELHSAIVLNAVGDTILEHITFDDVHLTFGGGGTAEDAHRDVPQVAGEYFVLGPIPAYGLYARNARGITLQNVRFQVATPDLRPAIVFDRVSDAAINGLSVQATAAAESVLRFIDSTEVLLTASRVLTPGPVFLQVEGAASQGITIDGGDHSKAARLVAFAKSATPASVKARI
ncbi:MAG TPA: glycosyl hydrolase family 28 protein [Vicinamibacterales bacterium]|jgi:hypothetical protein|nr:glycosyl hydrolase family 28 protein [Vicinamibacterales bacterium]